MSAARPDNGYIQGVYVMFRRDVLDDPELSGAARMVYIALASYATKDGRAWPSLPRIAARAGFSSRTVKRELSTLEKAGYLTRRGRPMVNGRRLTTMYYLGDPPPDDKQPAPSPERKRELPNVTAYQRPDEYQDSPEKEAALAELVVRFGGRRA